MASQPKNDEGDESLEELDLDDAAVISHQSEVHAPARRQPVHMDPRSIVVAEDPEPGARHGASRQVTTRRGRRALEPTLLIRDRREADELRREMDKRVRAMKREQLRSTLMWLLAGVLAFGLGGLIALLVARRQVANASDAERVGSTVEPPAAGQENNAPRATANSR
jgi:hypothetical protein